MFVNRYAKKDNVQTKYTKGNFQFGKVNANLLTIESVVSLY